MKKTERIVLEIIPSDQFFSSVTMKIFSSPCENHFVRRWLCEEIYWCAWRQYSDQKYLTSVSKMSRFSSVNFLCKMQYLLSSLFIFVPVFWSMKFELGPNFWIFFDITEVCLIKNLYRCIWRPSIIIAQLLTSICRNFERRSAKNKYGNCSNILLMLSCLKLSNCCLVPG